MVTSDAYKEESSSQVPALQLLINTGWQYLTPDEALALRGGKEKNVFLTGVLEPWLASDKAVEFTGKRYAFTEGMICEAVDRLVDEPHQSLMFANASAYELLTNHGKPFYALLDRVMPDWKTRRQRLNERERT